MMAGVANSEVDLSVPLTQPAPQPNFTDTLAAVNAVQRQVEALGSDFAAALQLVAERSQSLLHASGVAGRSFRRRSQFHDLPSSRRQ